MKQFKAMKKKLAAVLAFAMMVSAFAGLNVTSVLAAGPVINLPNGVTAVGNGAAVTTVGNDLVVTRTSSWGGLEIRGLTDGTTYDYTIKIQSAATGNSQIKIQDNSGAIFLAATNVSLTGYDTLTGSFDYVADPTGTPACARICFNSSSTTDAFMITELTITEQGVAGPTINLPNGVTAVGNGAAVTTVGNDLVVTRTSSWGGLEIRGLTDGTTYDYTIKIQSAATGNSQIKIQDNSGAIFLAATNVSLTGYDTLTGSFDYVADPTGTPACARICFNSSSTTDAFMITELTITEHTGGGTTGGGTTSGGALMQTTPYTDSTLGDATAFYSMTSDVSAADDGLQFTAAGSLAVSTGTYAVVKDYGTSSTTSINITSRTLDTNALNILTSAMTVDSANQYTLYVLGRTSPGALMQLVDSAASSTTYGSAVPAGASDGKFKLTYTFSAGTFPTSDISIQSLTSNATVPVDVFVDQIVIQEIVPAGGVYNLPDVTVSAGGWASDYLYDTSLIHLVNGQAFKLEFTVGLAVGTRFFVEAPQQPGNNGGFKPAMRNAGVADGTPGSNVAITAGNEGFYNITWYALVTDGYPLKIFNAAGGSAVTLTNIKLTVYTDSSDPLLASGEWTKAAANSGNGTVIASKINMDVNADVTADGESGVTGTTALTVNLDGDVGGAPAASDIQLTGAGSTMIGAVQYSGDGSTSTLTIPLTNITNNFMAASLAITKFPYTITVTPATFAIFKDPNTTTVNGVVSANGTSGTAQTTALLVNFGAPLSDVPTTIALTDSTGADITALLGSATLNSTGRILTIPIDMSTQYADIRGAKLTLAMDNYAFAIDYPSTFVICGNPATPVYTQTTFEEFYANNSASPKVANTWLLNSGDAIYSITADGKLQIVRGAAGHNYDALDLAIGNATINGLHYDGLRDGNYTIEVDYESADGLYLEAENGTPSYATLASGRNGTVSQDFSVAGGKATMKNSSNATVTGVTALRIKSGTADGTASTYYIREIRLIYVNSGATVLTIQSEQGPAATPAPTPGPTPLAGAPLPAQAQQYQAVTTSVAVPTAAPLNVVGVKNNGPDPSYLADSGGHGMGIQANGGTLTVYPDGSMGFSFPDGVKHPGMTMYTGSAVGGNTYYLDSANCFKPQPGVTYTITFDAYVIPASGTLDSDITLSVGGPSLLTTPQSYSLIYEATKTSGNIYVDMVGSSPGDTLVISNIVFNYDVPGASTLAYTVDNGTAVISAEAGANLVRAAAARDDKTATIDLSSGSSDVTGVQLPSSTFSAIGKGDVKLTLNLPGGSVTFSAAAASSIASQTKSPNVTVNIGAADVSTLTDAQLAAVGGGTVYQLSITDANGNAITSFGSGKVTVSLPYTLKPGENPNAIVIYYVDEDGNLQIVHNGTYDATTGLATFTTPHFSTYMIAENLVSFSDISGSWAQGVIEQAAARDLVHGVGGGLYNPTASVTRAEFIQMMFSVLDLPVPISTLAPYADITPDTWYFNAISAAKAAGLLKGLPTGITFDPNKALTRVEMATILANVANYCGMTVNSVDLSNLTDLSGVSAVNLAAIQTAIGAGLLSADGEGNGNFVPNGLTDRASAAQIQMNVLAQLK